MVVPSLPDCVRRCAVLMADVDLDALLLTRQSNMFNLAGAAARISAEPCVAAARPLNIRPATICA